VAGIRATSLQDFMDPAGRLMTQLPEKVMMALVNTPSMFAVPTCINKGFLPPFQVRGRAIPRLATTCSVHVKCVLHAG
jgi:hypothetical protein